MKTRKFSLLLIIALMITAASCKPYQEDIYVEVKPNETAFVVPLEQGTSKQATFESEEFLLEKKVAAKRIYTPTVWHQTKRGWWRGEYIPTVRVIIVDRRPITREWTADNNSGTSNNKKEDIEVESQESIAFGVKVTATANVPEDWAAKFLYNYSGRTLAQVMDYDVRARIQSILTTEFGKRPLTLCQNERSDVYDTMIKDVKDYFSEMGVNIMTIGPAGQFEYLDASIQIAINEKFSSEMKVVAAANEVEAAKKFAEARTMITAQKELDAGINFIYAMAEAMKTGRFPVPNTLVIGGEKQMSLMDIYGATKLQ